MKLYHTSDREIKNPDIHYGRKNADFGWGFYLTPDKDFTYRWARENAVVNVYELDERGLSIHRFVRDVDWFEYIFNNRRLKDGLSADVVIGPIANDTIFETMGIISSGFLAPQEALRLLLIGPEYTQVVLKSQKAADQLKWMSSHVVTDVADHQEVLKGEKEEYQKLFAAEMEKIG